MGEGTYLRKAEFVTNQREVLSYSKGVGGEKWTVEEGDLGECEMEAERRMEMGLLDGEMMLVVRGVVLGGAGKLRAWEN